MKLFLFLVVAMVFSSCFLFGHFKRSNFSYAGDGQTKTVRLVVPKGYSKTERRTDTATGNEEVFYTYPGRGVLYFVIAKDTTKEYQSINYQLNIPQSIYAGRFYKGVDSSDRYWRETKVHHYRAGYYNIERDDDWEFDSAVNYFMARVNGDAR